MPPRLIAAEFQFAISPNAQNSVAAIAKSEKGLARGGSDSFGGRDRVVLVRNHRRLVGRFSCGGGRRCFFAPDIAILITLKALFQRSDFCFKRFHFFKQFGINGRLLIEGFSKRQIGDYKDGATNSEKIASLLEPDGTKRSSLPERC